MGASVTPTGLGSSEEPEPNTRLGPTGAIPCAVPTLAMYMGVRVSDMPRLELEREFIAAHRKIRELQEEVCQRSIAHIKDLAALRRGR